MYDPLQALLQPSSNGQSGDNNNAINTGNNATSPPATPSKSRITSRPAPYVRPTPTSPGQISIDTGGGQSRGIGGPLSSVEQFANGAGQQYTSIVRSQSPLAPRPPLPGQMQRPVSPIQWSQSNLHQQQQQQQQPHTHTHTHESLSSATPQRASSLQGAPSFPFSPTSPNAWASSSTSTTSPPASAASTQASGSRPFHPQSTLSAHIPAPGPVPVPQPISGIAGPSFSSSSSSRPLNSPGIPRSPVAESPNRPLLSATGGGGSMYSPDFNNNGLSGGQQQQRQNHLQNQQQQQAVKLPPYIRIRVTGIDRAKKELGVKMDAQTNIPTYHRKQSPIFERTYNEFALLHGALSANHPETILPAMPLPQTSASNEDEEDRFLKGVFQKFMDRITKDKAVLLDDELRGFIEADFGYTPLTKAKKLKSGSGFLSRSTSKPLVGEDGEPDFLVTSKVHSAALESAITETCKSLDKVLKQQTTCASVYAELATSISSFSTTETHLPLTEGMKALSEAMTHIAQLETGQSNATALVMGDSLAYEAVEARSAKDALLQRQYNIDELRNSIKSTINKRRNIEKLRSGGSIKPERVNEALDDLEDAVKLETSLQNRVEAISRNLRPSLQTHLKTMNDDMISIALGQARTMLAYENRKLQIYENVFAKIQKIPERGSHEQSIVYVHPSQAQNTPQQQITSIGQDGTVGPAAGSGIATSNAIAGPTSSTSTASPSMSSSVSAQSHGSVSTTAAGGMAQSKFMATQAAIQAELQAQREREERQRAQYAQARAYQHQKSSSVVGQTQSPAAASTGSAQQPSYTGEQQQQQQSQASTSGIIPISPPRVQQVPPTPTPQSPLHGVGSSTATTSPGFGDSHASTGPGMTQSMYMPPPGGLINAPRLRSPPTSPLRHTQTASQQQHGGSTSSHGNGTIDPLLGGPGSADQPASSYATLPGHVIVNGSSATATATAGGHARVGSSSSNNNHSGSHMTQSVFLPGRSAQPGYRPVQATNQSADEKKRADARKAASFLAGAF